MKKRRLSKFNFEDEGSAVALVGDFQGGPANGVTTLLTKSTSDIDEEQMNKALQETSQEEPDDKVQKNSQSSVESQDEDVSKAEDENDPKTVNKEGTTMTTEVTQEDIQEQINKAAENIVSERLEAIEKAYNDKIEKATEELNVLKAREDAREQQVYLAKAEEYAKYLGEDADKEVIAKALKSVAGSEEASPLMDILKSLKDMVEQDDQKLFEEVGKSATQDQPTDFEAKVEAVQKSLMKEEGISEHAAYVKAHDQVRFEA